jgi:hypothetical protein
METILVALDLAINHDDNSWKQRAISHILLDLRYGMQTSIAL